jgi:hypothetical protein
VTCPGDRDSFIMEEKLQHVPKQLVGQHCQILVIKVNSVISYKTSVRFNKRTQCPEKNSLTEKDPGENPNQAVSDGTLIFNFPKISLSTDIYLSDQFCVFIN